MICSSCHSENNRESIYCSHCGVRLKQGAALGPSGTTEFHGERRQLTALFCDVVDSTVMAAALDPEEYHDVIRGFAGRCREVVESYGGYVAELQGDGALVFFGYPRSHGDEAERAVRAGIGIVKTFEELAIVGDRKLRVRIGIATGIMAINVSTSKKPTIVGDAVNLAARLQTLGEPNTIVISELTKRLAGSFFDFLDLGALPLKGFPRPVPAWRVVGIKSVPSRFHALRLSVLAEFVGREREMGLIVSSWDQVKNGKGRIVTISGEPGIGKSRLIKQVRDVLGEDVLAVQCSCSPYHMTTALHPVVEYVTRVAGFDVEHTTSGRRRSLETLVARTGSSYEVHLPWLASLMSLPDEGIPPSLSPQQRRQNTLRAIIFCLNELARKAPFVLILEDAHWVDPTSSELMELIADRIKTLPVLMIVSFRQPFGRSWMDDEHVVTIPLERLNRMEAGALVSDLVDKNTLSPELNDRIIEKSDGIPLYIEELTKMVLSSDASGEKTNSQTFANSLTSSELPTTLHDLLMARLDQLAPAKQVAQVAAVIGREFSYDLLSAIEDLPGKSLRSSLDQLIEAGLISTQGAASLQAFSFKHAMVRDAAYESLLKRDRRRLHAKVASVLERKHTAQPDIPPELLAHHYTQAGLTDQALTYWSSAAQRALLRSANAEVIGHTEKALEILAGLPESRERHRQELVFRFLAGGAYWAYKGYGSNEVEETFTRAQELAAEIGDAGQTVYAVRGLFGCYYVRAEPERAQKQAERVIKLARESQDRGDLMVGHMMLGSILFWRAEFKAAQHELETSLSLYDVAEQRTKMLSMQVDPGINAHMHLGATLWMLGSPDKALKISDQAVALARQMEQPFALAQALFFNCMVKWWRREIPAAETAVAELKTVAADYEITFLNATVPLLEGGLLISAGKADLGLARIKQAFAEFQAQQASLGKPFMMAVMATGFFRAGMVDEALTTLARGIGAAETSGELHWLAELHRLKGEILASLPSPRVSDASACIRQAIDIAVRQGAISLELRAVTSLCRIAETKAELEKATSELKSVYARFEDGFDTPDLREASSLLEELGIPSDSLGKQKLVHAAARPQRSKKQHSRAK